MKNKGFTLVELITTFALAAALVVILSNIVIILKDIYVKYEIKTELLIKQADLNKVIYDRFEESGCYYSILEPSISSCGSGCYTIKFKDGTNETMTISNNRITFGDYVYEAISGSNIAAQVDSVSVFPNKSFTNFKIIITHKLYKDQDFGINLVCINNQES